MRGRFVGRGDDLERLESVVTSTGARAGPSIALVTGAPGSGKSRLLREAMARAHPPPALRVVGYEPEASVPLAAARDILVELGRTRRSGRRLRSIAFGGAAWADHGTPLGLFEAAHRCVSERAPVALWVDDLQWVDPVTTALLSYLVRASAADGVPLAVVAASRPSPAVGTLRDALAGLLPDGSPIVEIELGPLDEDAGVAMVRSLAPSSDAAAARRIWMTARGSPFWIETLTIERDSVDTGLARRLRQLGTDGAAILQALAVIARPSDANELAALLGWEAERVEAAARELHGRGLAVESAAGVETAHDIIREVAHQQLPTAVARRLHARLARLLRKGASGDVHRLLEALDHARAADEDALGIALELVASGQRRVLGTEGVRTLAHLAEAFDSGDERRRALEEALAELATELGERPLELERWLAVAERAQGLARARALLGAAKAAYRMGRREAAADLLARARAIGARDLALEISLDALESEVLRWLDHRLPAARRLTTRALERADIAIAGASAAGVGLDRRLRSACIEALTAASDLALQEANEGDQAHFAERIVDLAEGELERMEALMLLASAYRRSSRYREAESIARTVRDEAERRLYPAVMVTAGQHLARALYSQARVEEAERISTEAERLSARIGLTGRYLSEVRNLRPGIAVSRGNWRAGIDRLRADIDGEPDPHYRLGIQQEISTWLSRLAGPDEADEVRAQVGEARRNLQAVGCPRCGRELGLKTAEALARIGDVAEARRAMSPFVVEQTRHSQEGRVYLRQALAAVLLASGRRHGAAAVLERLRRRLEAAGMHREALWADIDRAEALAPEDPATSIAILRSVLERARDGGVLTDLELARTRLRQLGVRSAPPRPRPHALGLSRRELEVARLAAAGATNPEIADTLFLSRKTVERHISAALAKIGARNRTELAARLAVAEPPDDSEMRELPDTEVPLAG